MDGVRAALRTLRLAGFARLVGAYSVNELGNWLGEVALAILVFDATGDPVATAALFLAMQFVPALATPVLVARVDHLPSRRALALLLCAEAIAFALLAMLAGESSFSLPAVLALAAADGAIATAVRARTRATAAAILEPAGELRQGNAVLNVVFTASAAAGPAMAGLVVSLAGVQAALLADAASFLAAAALLGASRALPAAAGADAEGRWWERMRRAVAYVRRRAALRRLVAAEAAAFVFFALVLPIEVAFAKESLDAGDAGYGLLLAAWGAGMVAGSLVFGALRGASLRSLLAGGTLAIGVAYCLTGLSPTLAWACAASVLGGAGNGVQWVAVMTAVQAITSGPYQARVVGLLESLASGASGVGFVAGGLIAAALDPRASYVVAGAGVLVVLTVAAALLRRVPLGEPVGQWPQPAQTQAAGPESAQI